MSMRQPFNKGKARHQFYLGIVTELRPKTNLRSICKFLLFFSNSERIVHNRKLALV